MGFGVPEEYKLTMRTKGVPIKPYQNERDRDLRRYFELHEGVTISEDGERFIVGSGIPVKKIETAAGDYFDVKSRCTMLNNRGRCMIYNERPDLCKNFTAETAKYYIVPAGCKYEKEAI
jgi:Fe-S-cluster containining protein